MIRSIAPLAIGGALGVAGAALMVIAGPLDPPPGAVASSYKTLTEVEPRIAINAANTPGNANSVFRITAPGSYYLTSNVVGAVGKNGIEIAASDVSIDLCGFVLLGVSNSLHGISSEADRSNLTIRNGAIRAWGKSGIDLSAGGSGSLIEDVLASDNGVLGIAGNVGAVLRACSAEGNADGGIWLAGGGTITECSVRGNGIAGILTGPGCAATRCSVHENLGIGIAVGAGSTVADCAASDNTGEGINAGSGGLVTRCAASSNGAEGIVTSVGAAVLDCVASSNTGDGIRVASDCLVRGNTCDSNGFGTGNGAGVMAAGNDSRIEANHCTDADRGIEVEAGGNLISGNTCSGNAINYSIAGNNFFGAIIDRTGLLVSAVNGSAAPSSLSTTDPHANFSY